MKAKEVIASAWESKNETVFEIRVTIPKSLLERKANGVVKAKSRKEVSEKMISILEKVDFEFSNRKAGPKTLEEVLEPYNHAPYKLY